MATVYLATDLRLERRVAIKVMHGHLADDSLYRARFIQEARSAARLAHPNVVNVYDQGQDGETAYLVMEYLPGITLRDLLQEHKVLTTVQSLDIMEAILSGLAAAHNNGIVHRDLKPENVLLADDGRIKIGDFGLARAATANTATGNALLGTIAYLSPELVTRGVADARSDIYAVGIMLYEMLAGEQPFRGEQAFQIAHQHANNTVPTPSTKNARVPAELDELVLWATARDPEQRPRDARAMLEQLHETEAILRHDDPAIAGTAIQRTMVMPIAAPTATAETQIVGRQARVVRAQDRTGLILAQDATALAVKSDRRRTRGWWLFGLVILLTALSGGTGWYFNVGPGAQATIPDLRGQTLSAATARLEKVNLTVSSTSGTAYSPAIAKGLVVQTTPEIGRSVRRGARITLLISTGPQPRPITKLNGLTEAAALAQITGQHFTYDAKKSTKQFDDTAPLGTVIQALGVDGADLATVSTYGDQQPIHLVVSAGSVPSVTGRSTEDATARLKAVGIIASPGKQDYSQTVKSGLVISIDQPVDAAGKPTILHPGDSISLVISQGPAPIPVPNVLNQTWATAQQTLTAAGFQIKFNNKTSQNLSNLPNTATVSSIDPGVGATVPTGSTLTVTLEVLNKSN